MKPRPFNLLADPTTYVACDWDLAVDRAGREHWVRFFKEHLALILATGVSAATARDEAPDSAVGRAESCREAFFAHFDNYARQPEGFGRVTILTLDKWRDQILRRHGFDDPFIYLKERENSKMLPLLAGVCERIDALPPEEQIKALVEGVFAGNIFDMGAEATARRFLGASPDFEAIRTQITPRPWLIDDLDALERFLLGERIHKCVFFIDNAGSDLLLGALPLARWLARRGTSVVLAGNERPSLNDMTAHDLRAWWPRIIAAEPSLAGLPLSIASTGTGEPLIDLAEVSDELNRAAAGADMVILEGMGRGIESNLDARFVCPALNIGMIKDEMIARRLGGKLYDVVCRFR